MKHLIAPLVLAALTAAPPGAVAERAAPRFRHERAVTSGGPGPNRLAVDVPILVGARPLRYDGAKVVGGLEDLRFYDSEGREVGTLRIDPAPPVERWEGGATLPLVGTKESSGFEVDLGELRRVDRLRLAGIPPPFLKRLGLEGSGDRAHWSVLVADGTVFDLPEEGLARTHVDFSAGDFRYLRVTWDDRSSAVVRTPARVSVRVVEPVVGAPSPTVPLAFERRPSEPGKSRFRIHLPGAGLPVVALELSAGGGHLLRNAQVSEPRLAGSEVIPALLGAGTLRRAVRGELVAADLRLPISRPEGPDLDLVVADGDNPPFELEAARVELAPLPWIYFESVSGQTLVARYGDPKLGAPRYDLEAVRDSIPGLEPAAARWGDVRGLEPVPEPNGETPAVEAVGAAIDRSPFRFARRISAGSPGLVALVLDAAVLAHSRDLADLRIADRAGRQVPYLVERLDEPLAVDLPALEPLTGDGQSTGDRQAAGARQTTGTRQATGAQQSRYRLRLPFEGLPPSRLVLATSGRIFTRGVAVVVERPAADPRSRPRVEQVAVASWRHVDSEQPVPALVLHLPHLGVATAEVRIDEGDNSPLPLSQPRLLLPGYRLRFFRAEPAELTLLYGEPGLAAPRYDLELLAPHVFGASALEVVPDPEEATTATEIETEATRKETRIFWGALVLAVVVLVGMIARLVAGGAPPAPGSPHAP